VARRVNIRAMNRLSYFLVALACVTPVRAADKAYAYEVETVGAAKRAAVTAVKSGDRLTRNVPLAATR